MNQTHDIAQQYDDATDAITNLLDAIRSTLADDSRLMVRHNSDVKIETSTAVDAVAMGATTLILQNIFKSPVLTTKSYL